MDSFSNYDNTHVAIFHRQRKWRFKKIELKKFKFRTRGASVSRSTSEQIRRTRVEETKRDAYSITRGAMAKVLPNNHLYKLTTAIEFIQYHSRLRTPYRRHYENGECSVVMWSEVQVMTSKKCCGFILCVLCLSGVIY